MTGADPIPIIYICGAGRSGSTLLEILLRERMDAIAVGEIRQIWSAGLRRNARCECGEPFDQCAFWCDVSTPLPNDPAAAQELEQAGRRLMGRRDRHRLIRGSKWWSDDQREFGAAMRGVYERAAIRSGCSSVLDSSKTASYGFVLAADPALDLHVVHLIRDSRAVAHSSGRQKVWMASTRPSHGPRYMKTRKPARAAWIWLAQNTLAMMLRRQATSYRVIRYEDLASEPDQVIADLLAGLPDELVGPRPSSALEHHGFMGNPIRFDRRPLEVRADEEWREALSARDHLLVTALTWPALLRFGYPFRRGGTAAGRT